jgi:hypothetical protein
MFPNSSADGLVLLGRRVRHGVWTKPLLLSEAVGITYFERWTRVESPSDLCSALIEIGSLRRRFSVQLLPMDESHGLRKSTSTGIRQPFEAYEPWVRKITAGAKWRCVRADTSTTWLSRIIEP